MKNAPIYIHGLIGIFFIVVAVFGCIFNSLILLEFFYFPLVWIGIILLVNNIVYYRWKSSLFVDYPNRLFAMFLISVTFWELFEALNYAIGNWLYEYEHDFKNSFMWEILKYLSFSTVIPAYFSILSFFEIDFSDL